MKDLRLNSAEEEYVFSYNYELVSSAGESENINFYTDTADKAITDGIAWEEFADRQGKQVNKLKKVWKVDRIGVTYWNKPWNTIDDLLDDVRGFDCVASARFVPALQGVYSPPKLHITPCQTSQKCDVVSRLDSYFSPLVVNVQDDTVTAITSPLIHR